MTDEGIPPSNGPPQDENQEDMYSDTRVPNGQSMYDSGAPNQHSRSDIIGSAHIRPVFLGNLSMECIAEDIEDLFIRPIIDVGGPIPVDRVDLKRGFGFVFLQDAKVQADKDRTERYVSHINGMEIHKISKAIRAEFARGDGRIKRKEDDRRKRIVPSETLFVVNFHEETTKREDLEMLFAPYGELVRIDMKRNYAFVQFTSVECASKAKDATNGGKLDQSVITVEYVAQRIVDDRRRDRGRGDRDRDHRGYRGRDYRGGYRRDDDYRRRDDRYDDMRRDRYDDYRGGFRGGRDRSPPRDRYDDYRGRRRSRSRSPIYRYRSRTPSPRRDRDDYRGSRGGGYDDYRAAGSGRSNERGVERNEYRDLERGLSTERDYRSGDVRGYK
eukprot:CAMPEP_0184871380 /NCGR_PEP_ID=MMETSP0580-20130426/40687_1 /TAXON_ID=1118495 /ORGANISM="Dactyliosolen fragilissimus" /LENGTH=384 /DNA_ID=CAMNT_0027374033 /DNA_START=925 /DNA_END=2079 /DNA_ORIENTATION=+